MTTEATIIEAPTTEVATGAISPEAAPAAPRPAGPEPAGFAAALRAGTQAVHREAERSGYVADLLRGRATRHGYALYLRNLLPAYEALEAELRRDDGRMPVLRAFAAPALFRAEALRADIEAIIGAPVDALPLLPEALAYATRVRAAAAESPAALAAHAYARYLGDLSGGQILKPLLGRTLDLGPDCLALYDFPDLADLTACKAGLRVALDTVDPRSDDATRFLAEAVAAFHHSSAVSVAVSAAASAASPPEV